MGAKQYDMLVIGAGLASLATVVSAQKTGPLRIIVIDGRGVGSNSTTPLTFADTIDEFQLTKAIRASYNRFTFLSPNATRSTHNFSGTPLVALNYHQACLDLLEQARDSGLDIVTDRVVRLDRVPFGWQVETSSGRQLSTRLLVDASGHSFFTARYLNLPIPSAASHSLGVRLNGCQIPDPGESFFVTPSRDFGNGGGWFYPLEEGRASLGVAMLQPGGKPFSRADLRVRLKQFRETLQPFNEWISCAQVEEEEWGRIPIYPLRHFTYDQLLLVGDRAGQATSWSCMGCEMALLSGKMAGEEACNALREDNTSRQALVRYDQRWRSRFGKIFHQAEQLAPLVYAQDDAQWDHNLMLLQKLSPPQIVERLRTNWPQLPSWQLAWIVWYDRAGRARRKLTRAITQRLSPEKR